MLRALLLLSVVLAVEASAKCASYALTVFPPTKDALPLNPVFVVRGFARAQELLKDPTTWRLVGPEGQRVPLKLQRTLNGYREQQLVFRTEEPLRPGAPYTLSTSARIKDWADGAVEKFTWTAAAAADFETPMWLSEPKLETPRHEELGCGPENAVEVHVSTSDQSAVHFEVTLDDGKTKSTYFPEAQSGSMSIGHGMCSGAFQMQVNTKHRASIVPVDAAGNRGPAREVSFMSAQ